eukprot:15444055-Alexandrium_andersonii.AAC.1
MPDTPEPAQEAQSASPQPPAAQSTAPVSKPKAPTLPADERSDAGSVVLQSPLSQPASSPPAA